MWRSENEFRWAFESREKFLSRIAFFMVRPTSLAAKCGVEASLGVEASA
jgi:hypothetical protein